MCMEVRPLKKLLPNHPTQVIILLTLMYILQYLLPNEFDLPSAEHRGMRSCTQLSLHLTLQETFCYHYAVKGRIKPSIRGLHHDLTSLKLSLLSETLQNNTRDLVELPVGKKAL